jgi:hypothetical protein
MNVRQAMLAVNAAIREASRTLNQPGSGRRLGRPCDVPTREPTPPDK